MFEFIRKRRLEKRVEGARAYILEWYEEVQDYISMDSFSDENQTEVHESPIQYSDRGTTVQYSDRGTAVQYSDRNTDNHRPVVQYSDRNVGRTDLYNEENVTRLLRGVSGGSAVKDVVNVLENNTNQTFVERLLYHINRKGVRDSAVYQAAQIDRRLFSKMVSDKNYKPSKDTAIALLFALKLSLDEAKDMLGRAGYTFSHSNKRDIILEFLFRERVCNLMEVNEILHRLEQKTLGRS